MTIKKYRIPALLLAALIAIAMIFTMTVTVQNAYAEDTPADGYEVELKGVKAACPGDTMDVEAIVKFDGQQVDPAAEGRHIEWKLSLMGPEVMDEWVESDSSSVNPDKHVTVGSDTTKARVVFKNPGTEVDTVLSITAYLIDKDGITPIVSSIYAQFQLASEIDEVIYLSEAGGTELFDQDQYLLTGKTQDINIQITHHKSGEAAVPLKVKYYWTVDNDGVQILHNGSPVSGVVTGENETFTFKRTDASKDTEVLLTVKDLDDNIIDNEQNVGFWFYQTSSDLADYQIEFNGTDGFFCFVDDKDLPIENADSAACKITVVSGKGDGHVVPNDAYDLKIQKVMGYDETTWEDILQDAKFPLTVDKEDSVNINGDRTDGTAQYVITAVANEKGRKYGYDGQTGTGTGRLWLIDRKTIVWPAVDLGFPEKNFNENQARYEAKTGSKLTPFMRSNDTGKDLVQDKDYSVKYIDNSSKKVYSSFPTKAGEYTVVFSGIKPYYGENNYIQLMVGKKNTMKAKGKTIVCKTKMKKGKTKKSKSFKAAKAVKVTKAKGAVSYSKVSGNSNITVADSGKITVKKGTKKGTYKIKVEVTAQGDSKYIAGRKTVTVKVRVR